MIEIFNAITNIARNITNDIFINNDSFSTLQNSSEETHNKIYKECSSIIEKELEYVKSVNCTIGKNKKQSCAINSKGKYFVSYVAIDNIDLLDVNFSLGSIIGIYKENFEADSLSAAAYILYGPSLKLIFASKNEEVKYFTYKNDEFILNGTLKLNNKSTILTTNRINFSDDSDQLIQKNFLNEGYQLSYSNSLVHSLHKILLKKGGIYYSPAIKNEGFEIVFEAFPIAFIIELAEGVAINDKGRILDIKSPTLHQTTTLYFGSEYETTKLLNYRSITDIKAIL